MRCKTCNYRLWNLAGRTCPECGTGFRPSEFEFLPNRVKFCCIHCGQAYYGTSNKGHLDPDAFTCVRCGVAVCMDEMIRLPADGVKEFEIEATHNPWMARSKIGRIRAFLRTAVQSMVSPTRLMRATPESSSVGQAFFFLAMCLMSALFGMLGQLLLFTSVMLLGSLPAVPGLALGAGAGGVGLILLAALVLLGVLLWTVVTHRVLHRTAANTGPIRVTLHALSYSAGPA